MSQHQSKRLSKASFDELPNALIKPKYQISEHQPGIVHIGIGAFHRGHQAVFTDDAIVNSGGDWRIIGVSLRSAGVAEQLNPQDGLYTVTAKQGDFTEHRLIGAVAKVLVAPQNPSAVINAMAMPSIKVITLTVTEKGYHYDLAKQAIDLSSADIQHDIANPDSPVSMPGFIVAACRQRSIHHPDAKLSVISCDNLPSNGQITSDVVLALAHKQDPALADWIKTHLRFCSSMVDRIVPAVSNEHRAELLATLGFDDQAMVQTETFKQWVIEDNFADATPDWASAGALIVNNVESYEHLKLRTLNGSHSALAYMGVLLGYTWIHEAINDELLGEFVQQMMVQESGPSILMPKGFDLATYQQDIIKRFKNEQIPYACQQVAMDGSQKIVQRIFAPMIDNLSKADSTSIKRLVCVVACWLCYLKGANEQGDKFDISDPQGDKLQSIAQQHTNPNELIKALCAQTNVFPQLLQDDKRFVDELSAALYTIQNNGLKAYLSGLVY